MSDKFDISKSVLVGETAEASLIRMSKVLRDQGINPDVTFEFITNEPGVFSGLGEVVQILSKILPEKYKDEVWALNDGDVFEKNEVVMRIKAKFAVLSSFLTALTGIVSSSSGWATGAKKCVDAANGIPIVNFGASQIHPNTVGIMDYSSIQGGAKGCSSIIGAKLTDLTPVGSMNENLVLIFKDVIDAAESLMNNGDAELAELPKIVSIGVLGDEAVEAEEVVANFPGVRGLKIETPTERGGVDGALLREIRERLDQKGFTNTQLSVSGDLTPKSINNIVEVEKEWLADLNRYQSSSTNQEYDQLNQNQSRRIVQAIGINRFIACHSPIDLAAYLKDIDGVPVSKRGKIPGITTNTRINKILFK